MPVLIPSFATCRPNMTAGELAVGKLLCKYLPEDCLIWYDIAVGHSYQRRYPDFIILHPQRGLVFLEVKDWRLDSLVRADPKVCTLKVNRHKRETLENHSNPLVQARQATFATVDQLKNIACLLHDSGTHQGRLMMPYGWGVVFSHITQSEMRGLLREATEAIFPTPLVLYKDDVQSEKGAALLSERIWGMLNVSFPCDLQPQQIDHIRATLFPEIVVPLQTSFIPKKQKADAGWARVMDEQQERVGRNMGDGHRVLHGVAGSGKTLVLVFRAKRLAETAEKPVLVISFTRALAAKLRSLFQDAKRRKILRLPIFTTGAKTNASAIMQPLKMPIWICSRGKF